MGAVGSMMALLRFAIQPNLVQTTEGQPVVVHTGPFGNIAHGCSSVLADRLALGYADYVVTEAGFGSDLGFEKFMHIKARFNDLEPRAAVLVASVRALKSHGGVRLRDLSTPNEDAVMAGMPNLEHHVRLVKSFGVPVVVAVNVFPPDSPEEIALVKQGAMDAGAFAVAESRVFAEGGAGGVELAEAVMEATKQESSVSYLYPRNAGLREKTLALAQKVYNAADVAWDPAARRQLNAYESLGWGNLPVCMAKTHRSISHVARLKGRPSGYTFQIANVRASVGAGFIYPIAGNIVTMPGLPRSPRTLDVDGDGRVLNL